MGAAVTYSYSGFTQQFPEFTYLSDVQVQVFWDMAFQHHNPGVGQKVSDAGTQATMLNFLAAHYAKLFGPLPNKAGTNDLVGRISNASEGSVSVQTEMPQGMPVGSAFYQQTKYGLAYWQLTKPYRSMRYFRSRRYDPSRVGTFGGRWTT